MPLENHMIQSQPTDPQCPVCGHQDIAPGLCNDCEKTHGECELCDECFELEDLIEIDNKLYCSKCAEQIEEKET